jgi:hypothetical protein
MGSQTYRFTRGMRIFTLLLVFIAPFAIRESYLLGKIGNLIFFSLGFPVVIAMFFDSWNFTIELNSTMIKKKLIGKAQITFNWDEIIRIKDDYFLFLHMYWVLTPRELPWWNWKKDLILGNIGLTDYPVLLANVITHVRPNTPVSKTILRHLNMTKEDIGKYYKQDIWIDKVKVNSYWKEKIF